MKINSRFTLAILMSCFFVSESYGAISLDRTRAIFNGGEKTLTLNIANDNKVLPYLAQAWLEDNNYQKLSTGPLIATPLVQRVEPDGKSSVRISKTPDINKLPKDRESVFYFNLREIPPKSKKANVLQIALQTKIKLFYRPDSIRTKPNQIWQDKLVLEKKNNKINIKNPTPYYVTVVGMGSTRDKAIKDKFDSVMVAPFSDTLVKSINSQSIYLTYINDYGGTPTIKFTCKAGICIVKDDK